MRQTRPIMGMPVTIEITDKNAKTEDIKKIFNYFRAVDERFSPYKKTSEISRINRGEISPKNYSPEMREIFRLAQKTKKETSGYFEIGPIGRCDPSGIVKGWAISNAAKKLRALGYKNY